MVPAKFCYKSLITGNLKRNSIEIQDGEEGGGVPGNTNEVGIAAPSTLTIVLQPRLILGSGLMFAAALRCCVPCLGIYPTPAIASIPAAIRATRWYHASRSSWL